MDSLVLVCVSLRNAFNRRGRPEVFAEEYGGPDPRSRVFFFLSVTAAEILTASRDAPRVRKDGLAPLEIVQTLRRQADLPDLEKLCLKSAE
jgi:hypothetical protein